MKEALAGCIQGGSIKWSMRVPTGTGACRQTCTESYPGIGLHFDSESKPPRKRIGGEILSISHLPRDPSELN